MDRFALLADCGSRFWRLQLGDTDALGLALTAGYLVTLALMARLVFLTPAHQFHGPRDRPLWALVLVVFAVLTVNKQLDLQHIATDMGRCYSEARGWYDARAGFQRNVGKLLLALGAATALGLVLWFRNVFAANLPLILGLALLSAYLLLQMTGILHLDRYLKAAVLSKPLHRTVEALALVALAWAAWAKSRPP